jgi:hypothetical protein
MGEWLTDETSLDREQFIDQFNNLTNYYFLAHP